PRLLRIFSLNIRNAMSQLTALHNRRKRMEPGNGNTLSILSWNSCWTSKSLV
ncbi:hypothetical protein AB1N83_014209, partial [Pleurotus pulmonarius]